MKLRWTVAACLVIELLIFVYLTCLAIVIGLLEWSTASFEGHTGIWAYPGLALPIVPALVCGALVLTLIGSVSRRQKDHGLGRIVLPIAEAGTLAVNLVVFVSAIGMLALNPPDTSIGLVATSLAALGSAAVALGYVAMRSRDWQRAPRSAATALRL